MSRTGSHHLIVPSIAQGVCVCGGGGHSYIHKYCVYCIQFVSCTDVLSPLTSSWISGLASYRRRRVAASALLSSQARNRALREF